MNWLISLVFLAPALGFCQDGTDLIDDTKEKPVATVSDSTISQEEAAAIRKEIGCLGHFLDALYKDCGRYPRTQEGLQALNSKPKSLECKNWGLKTKDGSKPYIAALPKNLLGLEYTSATGHSYQLKWLGVGPKQKVSVVDFLKTCPGAKEK